MFRAIAAFELKYHVKTPLFAFAVLAAFFFGMLAVCEADFGSNDAVKANSPYVIMQILLMFSMFGTLTTAAFVVNSIHRDFELNLDALFFSRPITKLQYMAGRFAGSFTASIVVFLGTFAAILIAPYTPWFPQEQLGPIAFYPSAFSLVVLVIPNLLLIGAILFAVATITRSLMATYTTMVLMALLYGVGVSMAWNIEREVVACLSDPFGVVTFFRVTRYWTVFEKNTHVVALSGLFLWNRVLWLSIGAAFLGIAYAAFSFTARKQPARAIAPEAPAERNRIVAIPRLAPMPQAWPQFRAIMRLEAITTLKSVPFLIILLCAVLFVAAEGLDSERLGQPLPVTRDMVAAIRDGFAVFSLMIAGFYAGDVVWRERTLKTSEMSDSMPVPTWTQWAAKLTSLVVIVLATVVVAILTTLAIQTVKGYHDYEFGLYLRAVGGHYGARLMLVTALAFLMQVFFNHKLAGFIGMALWFVLNGWMPSLGWDHPLYRYGSTPPSPYSDMNGYGHFVAPVVWSLLYWFLFAGVLLAAGHLVWIRGTETGLRYRLRTARQRFGKPIAITMAVLFAGCASTGGYIYYNTNVLNTYRSRDDVETQAVAMEKKYKKYERVPQPLIVSVQANVDLYPEKRAVSIDGSYVAVNQSGVPIRELHVTWLPRRLTSIDVSIPGARMTLNDPELGYRIYTLAKPLAPGASLPMKYRTAFEARGFVSGASNIKIVENGSFLNSFEFFPQLGYNVRGELQDDREAHGLPPLERMKPPTDARALMINHHGTNIAWISLDTTVSTSADQIAVAPGYLQKEWMQNGRRYFRYKTTAPIRGFWAYLSARYVVKRDSWNGVPIEIYYDPKHPYNVDHMIYAVKKSLAYFEKNFSPYQHKQVRILEFPGYATFAQALPNTIPWSETMGFITDLRSDDVLDYVFYAAAHEVAHQWWGHQIVGANVQGSAMLTESLAQYSALMVLSKELDDAKMKRYLRYELDRYLAWRGNERIREMPLALVERQDYIQYQKGAVVLYALQDYLGEERVNRALAKFLRDHAFATGPYPAALDLVQYFRAEAPPEYQDFITDLFERIILYDLQTQAATATRRADGKYVVRMTVAAAKLRSDGKGEEKPIPINDLVDLAVFAAAEDDNLGKTLFLEKRRMTKAVETFDIVVDEKPAKAGIDPFNKLIDREPKDNLKTM